MIINMDGEPCNCGNFGCVEAYLSIPIVAKKYISALKMRRNLQIVKPIQDIHYTDICVAAENGDELARSVIKSGAGHFGVSLANYFRLLNPQAVILSGPMIKYFKLFF